jgi:hypothetical protein
MEGCEMPRRISLLFVLVPVLICCGCGSPGEEVQRAAVTGTVTFDGEPVATGMILFVPEPGVKGPPVPVTIIAGEFQTDAAKGPTVGSNGIQITATRKTGKVITFQGEQSDEIVQYIPARYNERSELRQVVSATESENRFSFQLTSQ